MEPREYCFVLLRTSIYLPPFTPKANTLGMQCRPKLSQIVFAFLSTTRWATLHPEVGSGLPFRITGAQPKLPSLHPTMPVSNRLINRGIYLWPAEQPSRSAERSVQLRERGRDAL